MGWNHQPDMDLKCFFILAPKNLEMKICVAPEVPPTSVPTFGAEVLYLPVFPNWQD